VGRNLKVEVTLANGRKTEIEFTTDIYEYDMAKLREMYGDKNVREIE
jgi:hypothetical protein